MTDGAGDAKFHAVLDTSSDAIFTVDSDDKVVDWSRSAERIFGYAAGEMIDRPVHIVLTGDGAADAAAALSTARTGHVVRDVEVELQRHDGMPIAMLLSVAPVAPLGGGEASLLVLVARDVSERQAAQAALARAESRVWVAEALDHEGAWLWDVRTGTVQWSDQLHHIAGVDPVDFEGTLDAHLAVVHCDDRESLREAMDIAVRKAELFVVRCRMVRADGAVRSVDVRGVPAAASAGAVVGLRGTVRDVTES
jgi:PAS domain S-box-containing protein